ncbi:MAG: hypothetical protein CMO01_16665 [Thalassobius sp.]|nr:hypothetical protein [Thalassovita sp.]|tara:strand:+ start:23 stop:535 length:513 start_codon:yes stop_codon:yes gene_type:complete
MVIQKKKKSKIIDLIVFIPVSLAFLVLGIHELFREDTFLLKLFSIFLITASSLALRKMYFYILKIFSPHPEFEFTKHDFLIYDNSKYNSIPYADITNCLLFPSNQKAVELFLFLKPNSKIRGNITEDNEEYYKIPSTKKVVRLSLVFADIKPEKLVELIKERIDEPEKIN